VRVLATAVLVFEWIVLALAIPVAVNTSGVAATQAWIVFGAASALIVTALGLMRTSAGVPVGWGVQALALAAGLAVPLLAILAVLFAALYLAAIRLGGRVDALKAQRAAEDGSAPQASVTMAGPDKRP
jgi:hypothetical protein